MPDNDSSYEKTINDLVAKIGERMQPIIADMRIVNGLCAHAGIPPRYPDIESDAARGALAVKRDQFHAKPLATAVREYLDLRGPSDRGGLGAATVNEIYDALISGGYKPETSDETNAKRGLRIALTKNSYLFYRVSSAGPAGGTYGLLEWYPNAKQQQGDDKPRGAKRKRGRPPKAKHKAAKQHKPRDSENVVDLKSEAVKPANKPPVDPGKAA